MDSCGSAVVDIAKEAIDGKELKKSFPGKVLNYISDRRR